MEHLGRSAVLFTVLIAAACGPSRSNGVDDVDGDVSVDAPGSVDDPPLSSEQCDDSLDNDGDYRVDCSDVDCSGVGGCPVCGSVLYPEAQPLALPDGTDTKKTCSTNAQCNNAMQPNCVANECHASYLSTLNFVGFPDGATLTDPSKLLSVCVNMEHSWLRDLHMELITPSGATFVLHTFVDRMGGEIHLGAPNDLDDAATPVAGTGAEYCWTQTAPKTMLETAPYQGPGVIERLPPGNYESISSWSSLTNSPLNGSWSIRVTDLWPEDNGFMFSWSIKFDSTLVADCDGLIIL